MLPKPLTIACLLTTALVSIAPAEDARLDPAEDAAARGYRWLRTRPFLPADFDQSVFDQLWRNWNEPLRQQAADADLATRRRMTLDRYGLMPDPDAKDPTSVPALGHVAVAGNRGVMNCLTCHAGRIGGRVILGLPNPHLDGDQNYMEEPDWSRLYLWDRLRQKYLSLGADSLDRSAPKFFHG